MIGRLFGLASVAVSVLCLGTVLAQVVVVGYLWSTGMVTQDKLTRMAAVARDLDLEAVRAAVKAERDRWQTTQPSLADVARARALASRDLELREQHLHSALAQFKTERIKLVEQTGRYTELKSEFDAQLQKLHDSAVSTNEENVRLIIENIKPRQAKDQIMRMVKAGEMPAAVVLLSGMPVTKRAKVLGEFKTDEEAEKLAEMLRLIRESDPEIALIETAKSKVAPEDNRSP